MNSKDFRNIREAKKLLKEAEIKKEQQIDIKDYTEMLEKLRLLAQKHNPASIQTVDKLENELLNLNTERQYGKSIATKE